MISASTSKSTKPKVSPTQSQTLVTINPMTRSPPMRLGENILGHLLQEPRGRNKRLLRSRLLKGSPSAQPVCSLVEYLQKEECLFSNTAAFLQSQTNQHRAAAPTRMRFLNCFGIPLSHPPNRFATLEGLLMPQAACTIDQTILDRRQQKKRC